MQGESGVSVEKDIVIQGGCFRESVGQQAGARGGEQPGCLRLLRMRPMLHPADAGGADLR